MAYYLQHVLCPSGVLWATTFELLVDRYNPSAGTVRDQWFQSAQATRLEAIWFNAHAAYDIYQLPPAERPDLWIWCWDGEAEAP